MYFSTGAQLQAALSALPASKQGSFNPFDAFYYGQTYMVGYSGTLSPIDHFVTVGAARGYAPNAILNPTFYASQYADLTNKGFDSADLLYHFMMYGLDEGRLPNPTFLNFNAASYLSTNPDVATYVNANLSQFGGSTSNGAIAHYVKFGMAEGRTGAFLPDTYNLSVGNVSVTEGNSGSKLATLTLTLDKAATTEVQVAYSTSGGSATANDDYTPAAGTVTFAVGETSKTVSVTILGDANIEANETVDVHFSGAKLVASKHATVTITNDDFAPTPYTLAVGNVSVDEGNSGTKSVVLSLALDRAATETVTVNYQTANGSATAGADYVAASGSVVFAVGSQYAQVTITTNGDTLWEPGNETFSVNFSGGQLAANKSATVTINDDDVDPTTVPQIEHLTTGTDTVTTGVGPDEIYGSVFESGGSTYQAGDFIDGDGNDDLLQVEVVTAAEGNINVGNTTVQNVENMVIRATGAGSVSFGFTNFDGSLETVTIMESTAHVNLVDLQSVPVVTVDDMTGDVMIDVDAQIAAGNNDAIDINLREVGESAEGGTPTITTDGALEVVNLNDMGSAATESNIHLASGPGGDGFTDVNVTDSSGSSTRTGVLLALESVNGAGGVTVDSSSGFAGDLFVRVDDDDDNGSDDVSDVYTGIGNDTIVSMNDWSGYLSAGAGDDILMVGEDDTGWADFMGVANMGAGNDTVTIEDDNKGTINGDGGNDTISVGDDNQGTINGGNDNDTMTIADNQNAVVTGGEGNDSLTVGGNFGESSSTNMGAGNDTVIGTDMLYAASIVTGTGTDSVSVRDMADNALIDTGDDGDIVNVRNVAADGGDVGSVPAQILTGNGDDTVNVNATTGSPVSMSGSIDLGDGGDTVNFNAGDGDILVNGTVAGGTVLGATDNMFLNAMVGAGETRTLTVSGASVTGVEVLWLMADDVDGNLTGNEGTGVFNVNLGNFDSALQTVHVHETALLATANLSNYNGEMLHLLSNGPGNSVTDIQLNVSVASTFGGTAALTLIGNNAYDVGLDDQGVTGLTGNNGINTLNVTNDGSGFRTLALDGTSGVNLNVSGTNTSAMMITGVGQANFDSSAYAGNMTVTFTQDEDHTITTGAGNDRIDIVADTLTVLDTINGGGGRNTLVINDNTSTDLGLDDDEVFNNVSNIQVLEVWGDDDTTPTTQLQVSLDDDAYRVGIDTVDVRKDGTQAERADVLLDIGRDFERTSLAVSVMSGRVTIDNDGQDNLGKEITNIALMMHSADGGVAAEFIDAGNAATTNVDVTVHLNDGGGTTLIHDTATSGDNTVLADGEAVIDLFDDADEITSLTIADNNAGGENGIFTVIWSDQWKDSGAITIDASGVANNDDARTLGPENDGTGGMRFFGGAEDDAALTVHGSANADVIVGGQMSDVLNGNAGADVIWGDPEPGSIVGAGTQMVRSVTFEATDIVDANDVYQVTVGNQTYTYVAVGGETAANLAAAFAGLIGTADVDGDAADDVTATANTDAGGNPTPGVLYITGIDTADTAGVVVTSLALGEDIAVAAPAVPGSITITFANETYDAGDTVTGTGTTSVGAFTYLSGPLPPGSTDTSIATLVAGAGWGGVGLSAIAVGGVVTLTPLPGVNITALTMVVNDLGVTAAVPYSTLVAPVGLGAGETLTVNFPGFSATGLTIGAVVADINLHFGAGTAVDNGGTLTVFGPPDGSAPTLTAVTGASITGGDGGTVDITVTPGSTASSTDNSDPTLSGTVAADGGANPNTAPVVANVVAPEGAAFANANPAVGGNDVISGGEGGDTILGFGGNDTINGDGGDDMLWGGFGNDTLNGGTDDDTIYGEEGIDTINGGDGDDDLFGGDGVDTINGGNDDDLIVGGGAGDTLTGGSGADTFQYLAQSDSYGIASADLIMDFKPSESDKIDISALGVNNGFESVDNFGQALTSLVVGTVQAVYDTTAGVLWVNVDGNNLLDANDFAVKLVGAPTITGGDLILV